MIKFQKLEPCDVPESIDLYIDTFTRAPWFDKYESRDQIVTFFDKFMKNNYCLAYILKEDGKIVALSLGVKKPWENGCEYCIDQFCVKFDCQGKGYGSKLLDYIKTQLEKEGLDGLILNTERGYPSEKFYLKNGFKELKGLITLAI